MATFRTAASASFTTVASVADAASTIASAANHSAKALDYQAQSWAASAKAQAEAEAPLQTGLAQMRAVQQLAGARMEQAAFAAKSPAHAAALQQAQADWEALTSA